MDSYAWTTQSAWWPDYRSRERVGGHSQIGKPEESRSSTAKIFWCQVSNL